jgi:hypothetical protein
MIRVRHHCHAISGNASMCAAPRANEKWDRMAPPERGIELSIDRGPQVV